MFYVDQFMLTSLCFKLIYAEYLVGFQNLTNLQVHFILNLWKFLIFFFNINTILETKPICHLLPKQFLRSQLKV